MLAALGEPADRSLDDALGAAPARELRETVAAMAGRWAAATAGRQAAATAPPGAAFASTAVPGALVDGVAPFAEPERSGLPAALAASLGDFDGPLLLVAPDVPRLDERLAVAALGDLAAGCAVSFAPANDGRAFLIGLRSPEPELLELVAAGERSRESVLAAAFELGGDVGLLRSERRLVTAADARALAIDPLAPRELRALLD